mgnify:CR=1 FL=1
MPSTKEKRLPSAKLRSVKARSSTIGCLAVSTRAKKAIAERLAQHLRTEAATAHAEQEDVGEAFLPYLGGERFQSGCLLQRLVHRP